MHQAITPLFDDTGNITHFIACHHGIRSRLQEEEEIRLRSTVRKTDTVARLGGDEFIILLTDMGNVSITDELARKLITRIAEPYMIDGKKLEISVSIGISLFLRDGDSSEALLCCADTAMYAAKAEGHNRARFFDPSFVSHDVNLDKAVL